MMLADRGDELVLLGGAQPRQAADALLGFMDMIRQGVLHTLVIGRPGLALASHGNSCVQRLSCNTARALALPRFPPNWSYATVPGTRGQYGGDHRLMPFRLRC